MRMLWQIPVARGLQCALEYIQIMVVNWKGYDCVFIVLLCVPVYVFLCIVAYSFIATLGLVHWSPTIDASIGRAWVTP